VKKIKLQKKLDATIDYLNECQTKLAQISIELVESRKLNEKYNSTPKDHVYVDFGAITPIGICKLDDKTVIGYYNKANVYSELIYVTTEDEHKELIQQFKNSLF